MYHLYWNPGAASMAVHAALEEIGAPYELVHVDLDMGEQRTPAYLALNPHGVVPTLVADGRAISESHAILLHLADSHPRAGLAPAVGEAQRAELLSWLFWLSGPVLHTYSEFRYPQRAVDGEAAQRALSAHAEDRLDRQFAFVDQRLAASGGPFLLGARFSVADLSLAMLSRWSRWAKRPGFDYPNVRRHVDAVAARPAYRRMLEQEGIGALG